MTHPLLSYHRSVLMIVVLLGCAALPRTTAAARGASMMMMRFTTSYESSSSSSVPRGSEHWGRRQRGLLHLVEQDQEDDDDYDECQDLRTDCYQRAAHHGCITDFGNMHEECARTCLVCDNHHDNQVYALYNAAPQKLPSAKHPSLRQRVLQVVQDTETYMFQTVYASDEYQNIASDCQNDDPSCSFMAARGDCDAHPTYMHLHCAPACRACHFREFAQRCPFFPTDSNNVAETNVWGPHDLNAMFQRILTDDEWQPYHPTVLAQPQDDDDEEEEDDPWVLTLDDFVTDAECETLIQLGAAQGYQRSTDVAIEMNADGSLGSVVNEGRTSTNAWCDGPCLQHNVTQGILARLERLLQIPRSNYEHFQLLRYEVGQKYGVHHDYIDAMADRLPGPRVSMVCVCVCVVRWPPPFHHVGSAISHVGETTCSILDRS